MPAARLPDLFDGLIDLVVAQLVRAIREGDASEEAKGMAQTRDDERINDANSS